MAEVVGSHSDGHGRSVEGLERRRAYNRARQRARNAMAGLYPEEYRERFAVETAGHRAHSTLYQRGKETARRSVAEAHPDDYRRLLDAELARERGVWGRDG